MKIESWTKDPMGREIGHFLDGAWLQIPLPGGRIALPPNGTTLPYSYIGAMVNMPKSELASKILLGHAIDWLEQIHGSDLRKIVQPFTGEHDFSILCGGVPVRVRSDAAGWEMSFQAGGTRHEYKRPRLGSLIAKIPDIFGPGGLPTISEARQLAFIGEAADMIARASLIEQAAISIDIHVTSGVPRGNDDRSLWQRLGEIDAREVALHRSALGIGDPDSFDVSHKSLETLLAQVQGSS